MVPDVGTARDWLIWVVGGLFLVPFFTPVFTSAIVAWVLRMDARAFLWGVAFGIVSVPMSWISIQYAGWYGWLASVTASAALTALFLWWRARRRT